MYMSYTKKTRIIWDILILLYLEIWTTIKAFLIATIKGLGKTKEVLDDSGVDVQGYVQKPYTPCAFFAFLLL